MLAVRKLKAPGIHIGGQLELKHVGLLELRARLCLTDADNPVVMMRAING
jgi:hypothetical protein